MECGLLFSAGKDSSLSALLLEDFYQVTLVTAHFGFTDDWTYAREAAEALGFPFVAIELDAEVADEAVERMHEDGFPRAGIQTIHEAALEAAAVEYDVIADGTRRDDRVPTISRAVAQSLEDRHGVDYVAPLSGFGRGAIDRLVDSHLTVESGPSETIQKGDYETELRERIRNRWGEDAVAEIFPDHEQTRVTGRA
ncbi:alpha hydrolase [Natronomonas sp. F2-12]|jgi:predicted subunit of tRNA(5-methylaminomethyl-2-thiouridylate) methyltransferase|uniref:Alpha hydrolase n=1 Tax=Natronomonas aquatica TaxID=2841590 RepID=A0A9R1CTT1_9EURY|nr:asparagine synthase-related protein [Natronomonas aquatica]MCQ4333657.1 alpha hydrolase [Natronomonas aquatica]